MDFGQPRAKCRVRGNSLISSKDIGNVSVEGVTNQDSPATSQCIKPVEGDEYFDLVSTELFKHFIARVTSPLEGVRIAGLNSNQSELSRFMLVLSLSQHGSQIICQF